MNTTTNTLSDTVTVHPPFTKSTEESAVQTFDAYALSPEVIRALTQMGFTKPSPIQHNALPLIMKGSDLIGQAQTGTGKTAAFGIPLIEMIDTSSRNTQAVVLCPTRELALQVSQELQRIAQYTKEMRIVAVYGGESITRQITALRMGAHIVVATPGRLMDHVERRIISFGQVRFVVLDEADEMFDRGFRDDIESILKQMPEKRQTILFSATMSDDIMMLARKYQNNPQLIKMPAKELTATGVKQYYCELVSSREKMSALCRLLDYYGHKLSVIFCNTKRGVDEVSEFLNRHGYLAQALHGDIAQARRTQIMEACKKGAVTILVATNVAARGIDIEHVEAVYNIDVPTERESYVHRIGRTGRAGRTGVSFILASRREMRLLTELERFTKIKIERLPIPCAQELKKRKALALCEVIRNTIASSAELDHFRTILASIVDSDSLTVAAALAQLTLQREYSKIEGVTNIAINDNGEDSNDSRRGGRSNGGNGGGKPRRSRFNNFSGNRSFGGDRSSNSGDRNGGRGGRPSRFNSGGRKDRVSGGGAKRSHESSSASASPR